MKKILCFSCLCMALVACGSEDDYYVCKFKDTSSSATMEIYYDSETDEILEVVMDTEQKIAKEDLDSFSEDNFEDYWSKNTAALEMDGVSISRKYDKSERVASMSITIKVDDLEKANRKIFLIPNNLNVEDMINIVEKEEYICNY